MVVKVLVLTASSSTELNEEKGFPDKLEQQGRERERRRDNREDRV